MARIGETVRIKLPQALLAYKYRFACSIRSEKGNFYRHESGLRVYQERSVRRQISKILAKLTESAIGFVQAHQNLVVVVHADTVKLIASLSEEQGLGSLRILAKNSKQVFLVQADGFLLLLPRDFLRQRIPKKGLYDGHLPYEVLHQGALRHADIRYERIGFISRISKSLSREI